VRADYLSGIFSMPTLGGEAVQTARKTRTAVRVGAVIEPRTAGAAEFAAAAEAIGVGSLSPEV
jgi:hypothetical protein